MSLRRWTAVFGLVAWTGFLATGLLATALLALGADLAVAADLAVIPRHSGHQHPDTVTSKPDTSKPATEMRLEEFAAGANASCTAWNDGCRSCGKGPSGVFCSNVGIACLPSQPQCTRH